MYKRFDAFKQNNLAEQFHSLHITGRALLLANAWDCVSAKMIEEVGFSAVATTSAGMAWSLGYQDGENIPPELMIEAIGRIARVVSVPVTADIEGGYYRDDLESFANFISSVIEVGAVGINLEDSNPKTNILNDIEHQVKLIEIARKVSNEMKVNLFINARVDGFTLQNESLQDKINICINRAKFYEKAGANGIFVPFVSEIETVAELKAFINLPLNILITNTMEVVELKRLKVNRISIGGKLILSAMNNIKNVATEIKGTDNWDSLFVDELNYNHVNNYFM